MVMEMEAVGGRGCTFFVFEVVFCLRSHLVEYGFHD